MANAAPTSAEPPVLPVEESDTAVLEPAGPHRALAWISRGGGAIVEAGADPVKTPASVPAPSNGAFAIDSGMNRIFVAETYWSHGNRGNRADLFSIYDGRTLDLAKEIEIPGHLHVASKLGQMGVSSDDKLVYVYDMVPASVAHVIDIEAGKVLRSVDLPGCALIYPAGPRSFATLCGDGTMGAVNLDASGNGTAVFTAPFFDPDADPIFENSLVDRATGEGWMLSYSGKIYPVRVTPRPVVGKPWSLNEAAGLKAAGTGVQELAWRPGGTQLMAVHRATKKLFVLMHAGNYWTQKDGGTEVWVFDTERRTLLRRIKLAVRAKGIAVSQDEKPLLHAFGDTESAAYTIYDANSGKKLRERDLSGVGVVLTPGS